MSETPPENETREEAQTQAGKEDLELRDLDLGQDPHDGHLEGRGDESGLEAIYDVPVTVMAVLGTTRMHIHQLLKLGRGAVVVLDRHVGEAIDIYVNDRLVARGEIVIHEDKLGVTMTEIVKNK